MPQCLYVKIYNDTPVQCGKCMYCRQKRVSGWAARLLNKDMHSCMSFFVTLTYDSEHLMFSNKGLPTLYPSHLTQYFNLVRKKLPSRSVSYYAVGEYGSNRKRPHYHVLFFFNFEGNKHQPLPLQVLNIIDNEWKHGSTYSGTITGESVAYTLKYISKKPSVPLFRGDDRVREFSRMSKKLGIEYIQSTSRWHTADLLNRCYVALTDGYKGAMPRYYKDKIYTKEQRAIIGQWMEETLPKRDARTLIEQRKENQRKINT